LYKLVAQPTWNSRSVVQPLYRGKRRILETSIKHGKIPLEALVAQWIEHRFPKFGKGIFPVSAQSQEDPVKTRVFVTSRHIRPTYEKLQETGPLRYRDTQRRAPVPVTGAQFRIAGRTQSDCRWPTSPGRTGPPRTTATSPPACCPIAAPRLPQERRAAET